MKTVFTAITLTLLIVSSAMAKRTAAAADPSITTDQAVYSVPHFPKGERVQNGGVVESHHPETKKLLWRIQIYETEYDQALEKDVQDVFIKSLSLDQTHHLLILSDEKSRIFVLNLATKKVTGIE